MTIKKNVFCQETADWSHKNANVNFCLCTFHKPPKTHRHSIALVQELSTTGTAKLESNAHRVVESMSTVSPVLGGRCVPFFTPTNV